MLLSNSGFWNKRFIYRLHRFAYPCRFGDIMHLFGRSARELILITRVRLLIPFTKLTDSIEPALACSAVSKVIHRCCSRGVTLTNCLRFRLWHR